LTAPVGAPLSSGGLQPSPPSLSLWKLRSLARLLGLHRLALALQNGHEPIQAARLAGNILPILDVLVRRVRDAIPQTLRRNRRALDKLTDRLRRLKQRFAVQLAPTDLSARVSGARSVPRDG